MALFALTPSAGCNVPVAISPDIRHRGYFLCARSGHAHSHPHSKHKRSIKAEFVFLLPSESSVVSPPLYSWGAPTKTPPTFCHVGNKSASFIPIFSRLSAASLFGYLVWPLSRNGGGGEMWTDLLRNNEIQKKILSVQFS